MSCQQIKQTNNMIEDDHVISAHAPYLRQKGIFRFHVSILHLDNLLGIIFGQFKFLIDLEFGNDERIWFLGLLNHHSLWPFSSFHSLFWREVKMH